ncbi:MAG: hypothetical protein AAB466_11285 [Verrucomicrobiota bacterium]
MSSPTKPAPGARLDLSKWRNVPNRLVVMGGLLALIGLVASGLSKDQPFRQFGYSWLLAFMFFLSLGLGSLFLVLVHHLFDAGWSVPIRRFSEHIANLLFPWMAVLFLPIAVFAPKLYEWMGPQLQANPDHALHAKAPLFTYTGFYLVSAACFGLWWLLSSRLRYWSLQQDETGAAQCTYKMRFYASWGIFAFAITLTLAAIMWMKALQHEWFSTMYGVYYFAGSVWLTLATAYVITMILDRLDLICEVLHEHQYYFLGSLLFAFTVFYAYIHFSQYFIIWNANMPEETFWYVIREKGSWWDIGMIIIFGHFFVPFLTLLRIDVKQTFVIMAPLCLWAWLMHFFDLSFNIMPVLHPDGFPLRWLWLDLSCLAFMGGVLAKIFLRDFAAYAPYPQRDPRLLEAMGMHHPVPTQISGGELDETDQQRDAPLGLDGGDR